MVLKEYLESIISSAKENGNGEEECQQNDGMGQIKSITAFGEKITKKKRKKNKEAKEFQASLERFNKIMKLRNTLYVNGEDAKMSLTQPELDDMKIIMEKATTYKTTANFETVIYSKVLQMMNFETKSTEIFVQDINKNEGNMGNSNFIMVEPRETLDVFRTHIIKYNLTRLLRILSSQQGMTEGGFLQNIVNRISEQKEDIIISYIPRHQYDRMLETEQWNRLNNALYYYSNFNLDKMHEPGLYNLSIMEGVVIYTETDITSTKRLAKIRSINNAIPILTFTKKNMIGMRRYIIGAIIINDPYHYYECGTLFLNLTNRKTYIKTMEVEIGNKRVHVFNATVKQQVSIVID